MRAFVFGLKAPLEVRGERHRKLVGLADVADLEPPLGDCRRGVEAVCRKLPPRSGFKPLKPAHERGEKSRKLGRGPLRDTDEQGFGNVADDVGAQNAERRKRARLARHDNAAKAEPAREVCRV